MKSHLQVIRVKDHSPEWYEHRYTGIGGSEAGSVLGLNKWEASIELFHKKIGTTSMITELNEAMFHGIHLEEYVAKLWQHWDHEGQYMKNFSEDNMIRKCHRVNGYITNPKFPWLFASCDRLMNIGGAKLTTGEPLEEEGILECKTISGWAMEAWESGIPPYHITQVIQYMIVLETDYAEFAILKDGRNLSVVPVDLNAQSTQNIRQRIIDETHDFWHNRVVPGQKAFKEKIEAEKHGEHSLVEDLDAKIATLEPLPDGSEAYKNFLSQKELREPETMEGDMDHVGIAKTIMMAQAIKKEMVKVETLGKSRLMKLMIDNNVEVLDFDNLGRCDLKQRKGSDNRTFNVRLKQKPEDQDVLEEVKKLQYEY